MKTEKLVLSFIAIFLGLLAAGAGFYLFQAAKIVSPAKTKTVSITSPSPTPMPTVFLTVDKPEDEEVVGDKVLVISGKTASNAVVIIVTNSSEEVVTPSPAGNFATTVNLDNGQNILEIIAIAPNGESERVKKTVTYSLEEF